MSVLFLVVFSIDLNSCWKWLCMVSWVVVGLCWCRVLRMVVCFLLWVLLLLW